MKFSAEYTINRNTEIDNFFISEYMPYAPELYVKVYIYGLYLCGQKDDINKSVELLSNVLNEPYEKVIEAFEYFEGQGLVSIIRTDPIDIIYLPVKSSAKNKRYKPQKYADFNVQIQAILQKRMISPNEYYEYYALIESEKMEPAALTLIAGHCAKLKGDDINSRYILTVARNWANEGVRTFAQAEEKILEYERYNGEVAKLLKIMDIKRAPDFDDAAMLIRFKNAYGFDFDTIMYAAKKCKRKGLERLNQKLKQYYDLRLTTTSEFEQFEKQRGELTDIAKEINKIIGVYYEQLDQVIESYYAEWTAMGYSKDALKLIALACFKGNIRTLQGMNEQIAKFYKRGLISISSLEQHIDRSKAADEQIRRIFEELGLDKNITSWDRDFYRTWTYSWGMNTDILLYCASLSAGRDHPLAYMNKILSAWHEAKVTTLMQAKTMPAPAKQKETAKDKGLITHVYSDSDYRAMIDNIEDVEF